MRILQKIDRLPGGIILVPMLTTVLIACCVVITTVFSCFFTAGC